MLDPIGQFITQLIATAPMTAVFIFISRQLYDDMKAERAADRAERTKMWEQIIEMNKIISELSNAIENLLIATRRDVKLSKKEQGF